MIQVAVALLPGTRHVAQQAQPLHIQLHDGSARFGSALAWVTAKQATVLAGLCALLNAHVEQVVGRLPVLSLLAQVRGEGTAFAPP
jgi:hypothetical protein